MEVDGSVTPPLEGADEKGSANLRSASAMMSSQGGIGRKPHLAAQQDRLMVTNLVLENFKSYAGVQEIGPLHQCFTAVVGPNGSGKSNVIDAILFVFGHQAKKLRHARVSELIHKSEGYPDLQYAKVSVHFQRIINTSDDGSTFDIVPSSDFVVSRTALRDNSSKYHLDDKVVTRDYVVKHLKSHGIDMDNNRFLILQGEVEHIATMKPKAANPGDDNGLLEYLEDIIGSNKFVPLIDDATKELEVLSVERTRRLNRLRIVEKEKIQLEASKIQAEEHIAKQKSICDKRAAVYQHERWSHQFEVDKIEGKHHELLEAQEERKKAMSDREAEVLALEQKVAAQGKIVTTASRKLEKVKAKLKEFENEDITLREQVKTLNARETKLEKTLKTETAKISEKEALIEQLSKEKTELEANIANGEKQLAALEEKLQSMREKMSAVLAPLHEKMASKQRELMPYKETIASCEAKLDLARSKLDSQARRSEDSKSALETAKSQISGLTAKFSGLETNVQDSEKELGAKTEALRTAEGEVKTLKQRDAELASQVIAARSQLEEAARTKTSVGLLANLRKSVSQQVSNGILGKLGELGMIDEKYDTAVTTACAALENIVVINTETAQACVEVLKAKKLGRATFIILHEIRDHLEASKSKIQVPNGAQRLFDLVVPDSDEARLAFYHALQDTLVCEDLDTASSLAFGSKKRWRVVTTSGALFDFSGTISGGGHQRASGGMRVSKGGAASGNASKSKEAVVDVAGLKAQLEALNEELKTVRADLARAETTLAQLKVQVAKLTRTVEMARAELASAQTQQQTLTTTVSELTEESGAREKEYERVRVAMTKEISQVESELGKARDGAASGEASVTKLKQQIDEATGVELKNAEREHADLSQKLNDWTTTLTKHGVQTSSSEKAIVKSRDLITKAEADMAIVKSEISKLHETINSVTENALAATELLEQAGTEMSRENVVWKTLQEEAETLKSTMVGSKEATFQREEELKTVEKALREKHAIVHSLTKRLEELARQKADLQIEKDVPEDDLELREWSSEELEQLDDRELKAMKLEINRLTAELEGDILNVQAILEYREKLKVYLEQKAEVDDINAQFDAKHQELDSLRKQRLDCFMEGHSKINPKLKEMYTMITISGSADLEIANSTDPFLDGITFSVRPPNKSWRPIQNLSGGEKTLSSLALVFALHYYKPTPLYVMDEIDAALDFKNVSIVANYIKERTKDAQFLIVSLRNFMFELADRLVGIYKTDNTTKSVTINPSSFSLPTSS